MKKHTFKALLILTVILLILSSCNAKNNNSIGRFDGAEDLEMGMPETNTSGSAGSIFDSSESKENAPVSNGRKIIETFNFTVQTKEFESLLNNLHAQIASLGGYIENSSVSGREFDSMRNRNANFNIRIPSDKTSEFTNFVSNNSVVINESISTKDVTLNYVDMESRVSALESEKAALEKLLDNATSMSDIVDIRDKLTDVIYEIESYKSQLRTYDNLVEYSTINITIYEVERTAVVEERTVFQKIGDNLTENFERVWNGLINIFIFVISAIPYLIPIAIIAVIIILIIRAKIKKNKSKKSENNE